MGKNLNGKPKGRRSWLTGAGFSAASAVLLLISGVFVDPVKDVIRPYMERYTACVVIGFIAVVFLVGVAGYFSARTPDSDPYPSAGTVLQESPVEYFAQGDMHIHQAMPAQSSATSLHQLPPPPGDFTGREAELKDLLENVKQGGVAISGLQGTGGVGKTALALKLAEQLTSRYPDAQIYLDLKGVSPRPVTRAEAMAHVIRAWDRTANVPEDEAGLSALYMSVLHGKRALLLLDNAASAEQVQPLLPSEGCLALITSRQHFDLPDYYAKNLDMLLEDDARELVLRIARRVGDQADALAKLCGYLPLALRLAAGTLKNRSDLTVAGYMERLGDAKERLNLIDASLSLSYDLLSGEQQERWRMLGVFPGSFDAAAAGAVWELEQMQAEDELGELFLRSMVESETEGRYKLHDLSRVYADSKLSKIELATSQCRHAGHYVNVIHTADDLYMKGGESVLAGLRMFDLERGSIEAGQSWASKHWQHRDEAAKSCVGYALGCTYVLDLRLQPEEQIQWLNPALQAARRLKHQQTEAAVLGNLGNIYSLLGEHSRAIEFQQQALAIARATGERLGEAVALDNLGSDHDRMGDQRRAIEFHEQSLAIAREIGDRREEAHSLGNLGNAHVNLEDYRKAIDLYEQSLDISHEMGNRLEEANALWNMSLALDLLGERAHAIENAQTALAIYEQIGAPIAAESRRALAEWQGKG